jgi:E3 ubiquitin-protein ligase HECTD1
MTLGNEFSIPWSTIETLNSSSSSHPIDPSSNISIIKTASVTVGKTKQEQMKHRTTELALFIYNEYLKNVTPTNYTRSILNELKSIVDDLNNDLNSKSFQKLKEFLLDKTSLSLYELSSSGLVSSLLKIFHGLLNQTSDEINLANERAKLFCSIFLSDEQPQAFHILIRKLVSILESIEKLPLFLYDTPSNYGLQIFSKRFRFQLYYQNQQQLFTDRTGKSLKIEPLATVGQLRTFLASMVSKQWYDHPHGHLEFVKRLKSDSRQQFTYVNDFDQNGILYWIGTNAKTISDYSNPSSTGLVSITCSDNNCSNQQLSEMISHTPRTDDDDGTNNDTNRGYSWIMIDLGLFIIPTHFTLRHGTGGFPHWTKTFLFQISKDGIHFIPCEISLMNETNSSIATWNIKHNFNENSTGFRYIRIHQKSSRHPVCIAGLELYGQVISAIDLRSSMF